MNLNLLPSKTPSKLLVLLISTCILFFSFGLFSLGYARTVKIIAEDTEEQQSRLELRNITLPDGTEAQIYVIQGESIKVTIDENQADSTEITASHIEYDQEAALLRIIGEGVFKTQEEEIEGKDFSISLQDDTFDAFEVEIITGKVTVRGADATRFPGQLDVSAGNFTLCGRCDQEIEDYGFAAEEMRLYPKDRLVAYDVTVLVRENPIFYLPLLILPLGPEDKQPRFDLNSGTATSRATTSLHWPYIFAESSFGRLGINYYADVLTTDVDFFSEQLLGGAIATSYFGLDWFHRFYTDYGKADLNFKYVPAFVQYNGSNPENDPTGNTKDEINISLNYSESIPTDSQNNSGQVNQQIPSDNLFFGISRPQINFIAKRNDTSRQRIGEYELNLKSTVHDFKADFFSQGYYDFDSEDEVERPSYSTSFGQGGTPNVTYGNLRLEPTNPNYSTNFEFGNLNLSGFIAEIGFFQDDSNSNNRSASQQEIIHALRILINQPNLNFNVNVPDTGTNLSLTNDFTGQYYSTQNPDGDFERLVLWNTRFNLTQNLDKYVSLTGGLNRIYRQGETPFSFDGNSLQERTDGNFGVNITPFDWIGLNFSQSYVFNDSRDKSSEGWGNLSSSLRLFDNNSWFNMNLNNSYDFKNEEPGFLRADIHFRFPAPFWYFPPSVETPDEIDGIDSELTSEIEKGDFTEDGNLTEDGDLGEEGLDVEKPLQESNQEVLNSDTPASPSEQETKTYVEIDSASENLVQENLANENTIADDAEKPSIDDSETVSPEVTGTESADFATSDLDTDSLESTDTDANGLKANGPKVNGTKANSLEANGSESNKLEVDSVNINSDIESSEKVEADKVVLDGFVTEANDDSQVLDADSQTSGNQVVDGNNSTSLETEVEAIQVPDELAEGLQEDDKAFRSEANNLQNSEQNLAQNSNEINEQNLDLNAEVPVRPNYNIALDIDHQQDLKVEDEQRDETRTSFRLFGNYENFFSFDAQTAYNYVPDTTTEPYPYWDKLTTSVTLGTGDTFDAIPNLTLSHRHDLNTGKGESLTIAAGATYDPFEFSVSQTLNLLCQEKSSESNDSCDVSTSSFRVLWRDVVELNASGFPLIPLSLFLLDPELKSQEYKFVLKPIQAFQNESANWSVTYSSRYDPFLTTLSGETGGWRDSGLSGNYELLDSIYATPVGDVRLASTINAEYLFSDDVLLESYFRRIGLSFRGDLFGNLGIAGDLTYGASASKGTDPDTNEDIQIYSRNELSLSNVSFATKVAPDVYVAAVFNDIWDFRDEETNTVTQTPWNLQPEIHLIWDRCCWALSGSWDSSSGEISISLGLDDIQQGFSQEFETDIVLPGRTTQ